MKPKKDIYSVGIEDTNYSGNYSHYTGLASSVEEAAKHGLRIYVAQHRVKKHEMPLAPVVRSIQRFGPQDF